MTDATDSNSEDEEPLQSKRRVSGQMNTVRVDRAQGGTTIIINNSSGGSHVNSSPTPSPTPTELEQSQTTPTENTVVAEVPSDVAASPD